MCIRDRYWPLQQASHRRITSFGCWPTGSDRRLGGERINSAASVRTSAAGAAAPRSPRSS
eukprot:3843102-Alexandrium_andersonii.AAC.1